MKLLEQELFPAAADGVPVIPAARQPGQRPGAFSLLQHPLRPAGSGLDPGLTGIAAGINRIALAAQSGNSAAFPVKNFIEFPQRTESQLRIQRPIHTILNPLQIPPGGSAAMISHTIEL